MQCYSALYIIFMIWLFVIIIKWSIYIPGFNHRGHYFIDHIREEIFIAITCSLLFLYPIIVIISLLSISKKVAWIEKTIRENISEDKKEKYLGK